MADTLNSSVTDKEKKNKMKHIYLQLCDYPKKMLGNLIQPNRSFVKESEFYWVNTTNKMHSKLWVILFNDIILLCIKGDHVLQFVAQLNLSESKIMKLSNVSKENNSKFFFQISIESSSFILGTDSQSERDEWFDQIIKFIDERNLSLKENDKSNLKKYHSMDMSYLSLATPEVLRKFDNDFNPNNKYQGNNLKGLMDPMKSEQFLKRMKQIDLKKVIFIIFFIFLLLQF